ncbi:MAG TPA: phospholipase D-like domain-containing protein [Gemmatimonadota bacterium]|nr:phospholipase D-like domain-containing protein [Gemmatimonadota bacterium]
MQQSAAIAVSERSLIDQAFTRASGAERIEGNRVWLLRDASENYPAWFDAIAAAERYVYFENYIIRDDASGARLADALSERAGAGVKVRLLYDWGGALGKTSGRYWEALRAAGVEVRCFNPFRLTSPLGWVCRNHRKSLVVDGRAGFITGLCVGDEWAGDPARGIPQWRDTGIGVDGPAVKAIEQAFARVWGLVGPAIPEGERRTGPVPVTGNVAVRIVASEPNRAELLRVDQLVASAARETLWLADAYYAGVPSHVQAICSAALDGVDVRLLLPGATDLPVVRAISRAGYRPLLEAGVRVFEWNGPMLHSKTAVADGLWARVGSSNLNIASWLANYELDAVVEDAGFAGDMTRQYEADLANSTEVVLGAPRRKRERPRVRRGSAGRAAVLGIRLGNALTAAVNSHRAIAAQEAGLLAGAGGAAIVVAILALLWPRLFAIPFAVILAWLGATLLARAWRLRRERISGARSEDG